MLDPKSPVLGYCAAWVCVSFALLSGARWGGEGEGGGEQRTDEAREEKALTTEVDFFRIRPAGMLSLSLLVFVVVVESVSVDKSDCPVDVDSDGAGFANIECFESATMYKWADVDCFFGHGGGVSGMKNAVEVLEVEKAPSDDI